MSYRPLNPSVVLVLPNSGMLGGPLGDSSTRTASDMPTSSSAAANRSGRSVMPRPIVMPPALPPSPASRAAAVNLYPIRYSAHAMKSRHVFDLVNSFHATCHSSPYSPPPRACATAHPPPRPAHAIHLATK